MTITELQADYLKQRSSADRFLAEFLHQFAPLVETSGVKLALPIVGRVKEWDSLYEKLNRKSIEFGIMR